MRKACLKPLAAFTENELNGCSPRASDLQSKMANDCSGEAYFPKYLAYIDLSLPLPWQQGITVKPDFESNSLKGYHRVRKAHGNTHLHLTLQIESYLPLLTGSDTLVKGRGQDLRCVARLPVKQKILTALSCLFKVSP